MSFELGLERIAEIVFWLYLGWVSYQDIQSMKVIRYSHMLGMLSVFILGAVRWNSISPVLEIYVLDGIFLMLLQKIMVKLGWHGRADGYTLCLCGLYLMASENLTDFWIRYLLFQILAGLLLCIVEFMKGNLKGAYLGHPVAYIPYISVAFILTKVGI